MPSPAYVKRGLILQKGPNTGNEDRVRALQHDLRALGYLRSGIDGAFGSGTQRAILALQHDLLHNHGESTRRDGTAPIAIGDFNKGRVTDINGEMDQNLAACVVDLMECDEFPKIPKSDDPRADNKAFAEQLAATKSKKVPIPFLMAILKQESGLRHFNQPGRGNDDTFVIVGLDTNASEKHIITSRGYGAGQYTLFHHPPTQAEHEDYIQNPKKNLKHAIGELRNKFDHFVNGPTGSTRADDRISEVGKGPLRLCKYEETDPRYLNDCRQCARDVGNTSIRNETTRLHPGTRHVFKPTQYYRKADYDGVPTRKNFECDWPYAIRRYNGSGINSYHYQAIILKNLKKI